LKRSVKSAAGNRLDSCGIVEVINTGKDGVPVFEMSECFSRVESGPLMRAPNFELRYLRTVGQGELTRPLEVAWDDRGSLFDSRSEVQNGLLKCWNFGIQQCKNPLLQRKKLWLPLTAKRSGSKSSGLFYFLWI